MFPKVVAVILNWNNAPDTLACIESLRQSDYPALTILVVDNASDNDSVEVIHTAYPQTLILETGANLGYTGGNNAGIRWALDHGAEWVFILNNDTTQAPNCIRQMVAQGEANPYAGIIGPTVYHADRPDVIQSAGGMVDPRWGFNHRGENQAEAGQFTIPTVVEWISGCALFARAEMIRQVGMLDDRFYMYREEVEWCLRARQSGWQVVQVPQAHLWHAGVRPDYRPKPYVTYYMTRNLFLLLSARRAGFRPWFDATLQTARTLISWSLKPQWRTQRDHRDAMWRGVSDFLRKRWGAL